MSDIDDAIKGIKEQRAFPPMLDRDALCQRCFRRPVVTYPGDELDIKRGETTIREKYCSTCLNQ